MAIDRLSAQDLQILKLEAGSVRGHWCKILILERSAGRALPTLEQLRAGIAARLDGAPRLRQRLVRTPLHVASPAWLDDPGFDIAQHVTAVQTDGPVNRDGLERITARLMAQRLDRSRPLWHIGVVEELDDGGMALIWRIHHCMADGGVAMKIGSAVLWPPAAQAPQSQGASPAPTRPETAPHRWEPQPCPGPMTLMLLGLRDHGRSRPHRGSRPGLRALLDSREVLTRELSPTATVTELAHHAGPNRSVALVKAPLAGCHKAGKAIGEWVTVNDVVLAIVAGGVRTWLERRHDPLTSIRVKVPVSLHRDGEETTAGNRDSCFFVDLPVSEPDPAARVLAVTSETRARKRSHDADALYGLGMRPLVAHWAMSPRVFTFNVSNVRGPAGDVDVYGARLREMYSLAEIAQEHVLRVAVISTGDVLGFGLLADSDAVDDLQVLADGIRDSAAELLALAA